MRESHVAVLHGSASPGLPCAPSTRLCPRGRSVLSQACPFTQASSGFTQRGVLARYPREEGNETQVSQRPPAATFLSLDWIPPLKATKPLPELFLANAHQFFLSCFGPTIGDGSTWGAAPSLLLFLNPPPHLCKQFFIKLFTSAPSVSCQGPDGSALEKQLQQVLRNTVVKTGRFQALQNSASKINSSQTSFPSVWFNAHNTDRLFLIPFLS